MREEVGKLSETVTRFWDAVRRGDVDGAFAEVDESAEVHIPPAGVSGGKEEARAFFAETVTAFPDLLLAEKSSFTGADGTVVTQLKMEGTQAADYLGVINQEKHLDLDQAWMLGVGGGRITSIKGFWDQNILYRRLAVKRLDSVSII